MNVNFAPLIIPVLLLVVFLYFFFAPRKKVLGRWHCSHDFLSVSSVEFYAFVKEGIFRRDAPKVGYSDVAHSEVVLVGRDRKYLRVSRNEYYFDICAAPFGTSFFFSWWFVRKETFFTRMIRKIPVVSDLFALRTYYQLDSEAMFRDLVHTAVLESMDAVTEGKGVRGLTERERQPEEEKG